MDDPQDYWTKDKFSVMCVHVYELLGGTCSLSYMYMYSSS